MNKPNGNCKIFFVVFFFKSLYVFGITTVLCKSLRPTLDLMFHKCSDFPLNINTTGGYGKYLHCIKNTKNASRRKIQRDEGQKNGMERHTTAKDSFEKMSSKILVEHLAALPGSTNKNKKESVVLAAILLPDQASKWHLDEAARC